MMRVNRLRRIAIAVGAVAGAMAWCGLSAVPAGAAGGSASAIITPNADGRPYQNGETLDISVGPNDTFTPNARIVIMECGAPHGVLPTSDLACDGETIQSGSVLVGSNGSFRVPDYTMYSLPNLVFGGEADTLPICNATTECVLFIGQNQNDFSAPKIFSSPYFVDPTANSTPQEPVTASGGGTATGTSDSTDVSTPSGSTGGVSAEVALTGGDSVAPAGSLAFSGIGVLPQLIEVGAAMVIVGLGLCRRRRDAA